MSYKEAMAKAYEKRIQVVSDVNTEIEVMRNMREEQVKIVEEEKQKMSTLAFTIIGAVMSFTPESFQNTLVVIGLSTLILNAFIFGHVAIMLQRKSNIRHSDDGIEKVKECVKPYYDAYDDMIKDDPVTQEKYGYMQDAYIKYLEDHKNLTRKPSVSKKTRLAIGIWFYIIYFIAIVILGIGLVQKYIFDCNRLLCNDETHAMHIEFVTVGKLQ